MRRWLAGIEQFSWFELLLLSSTVLEGWAKPLNRLFFSRHFASSRKHNGNEKQMVRDGFVKYPANRTASANLSWSFLRSLVIHRLIDCSGIFRGEFHRTAPLGDG